MQASQQCLYDTYEVMGSASKAYCRVPEYVVWVQFQGCPTGRAGGLRFARGGLQPLPLLRLF